MGEPFLVYDFRRVGQDWLDEAQLTRSEDGVSQKKAWSELGKVSMMLWTCGMATAIEKLEEELNDIGKWE